MVVLELSGPTPPYEQIREQLTAYIRSGELEGGRKLPSIRQLAGDLRIAPGTVARAYRELEAAGLIDSGRTTGTRVRPGQQSDPGLRESASRFVTDAKNAGVDLNDAISAVRAAWGRT